MPFKSLSQYRAFRLMESRGDIPKGTTRKWLAHTPGGLKGLPDRKKKPHKRAGADTPAAAVSTEEAFARAFLAGCRADGLSPADTLKVARALVDPAKRAGVEDAAGSLLGSGLSNVAGAVTNLGLGGTVGIPAAAGAGVGLLVGHLRNQADAGDLKALQTAAVARAWRRRADEMALRRLATQPADGQTQRVVLG